MKKYESVIDKLSHVKAFVMWEEKPAGGSDSRVIYWEDFLELGKKISDDKLIERRHTIKPNQVCNLVYTSGTTGMPKGVMLTHDNMTYFMQSAMKDALSAYEQYPGELAVSEERIITYLPLSHVAA